MAHIAKFVSPGAVRVESDSDHSVAFVNPDGSTSLVVYNDSSGSSAYRFAKNGSYFDYVLPLMPTMPAQKAGNAG